MAKKSKARKARDAAFHEVMHNTPTIVYRTRADAGPEQAHKQKIAIALNKARRSQRKK